LFRGVRGERLNAAHRCAVWAAAVGVTWGWVGVTQTKIW
jgi:hypothetical protein